MKKIIIISSLVFVCPFSVYAKNEKQKTEAPPPPPRMMMHHQMMMMPRSPGRHGMMMPRRNTRLKSELHIRARLKDRYNMSEEDTAIILRARQEILDVMQKYAPSPGEGDAPPPPIF